MKTWIPNTITLLNLFCGGAAIIAILDQHFIAAFWWLVAAVVFDFADGLVARALHVSSEQGKELDSLADMVSFGLVPGMIYYVLLGSRDAGQVTSAFNWAAAPAFLITLFSALRLAKFNLDTRQTDHFLGLATPSSTFYAVGLMLIYATDAFGWAKWVASPWVVYASVLLFSGLLVSEIPMFSFKLKGFGWQGNQLRYLFLALVLVLLLLLQQAAFSFIVLTYVLLNLGQWLRTGRG